MNIIKMASHIIIISDHVIPEPVLPGSTRRPTMASQVIHVVNIIETDKTGKS